MGALCSPAHVHYTLYYISVFFVGGGGGLVGLGAAGQAMEEEERREKVKRVMRVIICAELTGRCGERFVTKKKRGFLKRHAFLSFSFLRMTRGFT